MTTTDEYFQVHQSRLRHLQQKIDSIHLPKNSRILDIGCYPPYTYHYLQKKYKNTSGLTSPFEKLKSPKVKIVDIDKENLPYQNDTFDLIIFCEIIEHLSNPNQVAKEITRILKPGGKVIVTTPNIFRIQNIVSLLLRRNIYFPLNQLTQPINFRHQREYSLPEVISIFSEKGLNHFTSEYFIGYPPFRPKNKNNPLWLKLTKYLVFCLSTLFPIWKDSLMVIFQK